MSLLLSFVGIALLHGASAGVPIQDPTDTVLDGCYTEPPPNNGAPLKVLRNGVTPNGFSTAARGWNSYGCQAVPGACPSFVAPTLTQDFILSQCEVLAQPAFAAAGYDMCSLDSGWNGAETDDYGRTVYNSANFDFPELGNHLHSIGLKLGVYFVPGFPCGAMNKTIMGTNTTLAEVWDGNDDEISNCNFDYTLPATQTWHDSQVALFNEYGVDMLKLDFVTPGSPYNGAQLPANTSDGVIAWHKAIENSGKPMRLDISWKLCRNETYFSIWEANADSMRIDQDVNNYGSPTDPHYTFIVMEEIQRTIDNVRQFIALQTTKNKPMTIRPDMDDVLIANPANNSGVTDGQRTMVMTMWLATGGNLVLGSNMTSIDDLGMKLLTSPESIAATAFCNDFPVQPRNPGTGDNLSVQLSAWVGGPNAAGDAVVVLANLGYSRGYGGYSTTLQGVQEITASLAHLGIDDQPCYTVTDIWNGNSSVVHQGGSLTAYVDDGNVSFFNLTASC